MTVDVRFFFSISSASDVVASAMPPMSPHAHGGAPKSSPPNTYFTVAEQAANGTMKNAHEAIVIMTPASGYLAGSVNHRTGVQYDG